MECEKLSSGTIECTIRCTSFLKHAYDWVNFFKFDFGGFRLELLRGSSPKGIRGFDLHERCVISDEGDFWACKSNRLHVDILWFFLY